MNRSLELTTPMGWLNTQFEEIIDLISGQHILSNDYSNQPIGIPYLTGPADFDDVYPIISKWTSKPKVVAQEKDILITVKGAGVGKTNILGIERAAISRQLMAIRSKAIDPYYMFFFLKANFDNLQKLGVGSTVPGIDRKTLFSITIPLPPLNEQHRIVAKIEALTARSRKAREALDAIPTLLDQFRQSVLAAAFRGDLTADWRAQNPNVEPAEKLLEQSTAQMGLSQKQIRNEIDRDNARIPDTWEWTRLKTIIQKIQAGKNFKCPEIPVQKDTVGLAKISTVTWGTFDPLETKTVEDLSKVDPSLFIQKGDLLVTRANTLELVGASVVVHDISYKIMLSDKVWRIHTLEIDKEYLNFYLRSKIGRKEIESRASGNQQSMRNISQKAFLDIVCMIPPLKEQIEISKRIKAAFSILENVQQQYQSSLSDIDQLDQSILAKAFRGELVPQDPNDEPASVLLKRIQAEQAKLNGQAQTKTKAKKKK